ncbi:MAG: hypothetical protein AVDCRST_MAG40-1540 [uncultured Gemmatimonadaceae bacterium]|uniref:Uncharacterized protein n=1 Tax=uncultured Gemmatimonadaceae bacterium TaxID=246130 RepID=A0A6J4L9C3_9BACT|nr:MAG: hypothetical protein AVDCRST_MAG40-1540 [uncultured Gemmatimonadaceae bacterium]
MAEKRASGPAGLVSMVCITCGAEQSFDTRVPARITCTKCQGTVFREFDTPTEPDEATIDQLDAQARSRSLGDPSPGTSADELADLDDR